MRTIFGALISARVEIGRRIRFNSELIAYLYRSAQTMCVFVFVAVDLSTVQAQSRNHDFNK